MRAICVIRDGVLQSVYSDSAELSIELLDYDNMNACDLESKRGKEEYESYEELEKEIESGSLHCVW